MLHWLCLALALAASRATFVDSSQGSKEPSDTPYQCHGRAWVRAPDMVPGDVITGDVKVKLNGPCTNAETYALGLRYKERIVWKLRRQDAPLPKSPEIKYYEPMMPSDTKHDLFEARVPGLNAHRNPEYNQTEWMTYRESFENKDLWTVHEEERIAFEIKTNLAGVNGGDTLPTSFTARFGILVPNTNYPPGLDYRHGGGMFHFWGKTDTIHSESIYEYFVEVKFSNGTTSEIPAGITAFAPFYPLTEVDALPVNLSVARTHHGPVPGPEPPVDMLQSNYTIEISFPNGTQVHQNSSMNIMATVHRTGYTNRTDIPTELCAHLNRPNAVEWLSQELKNRSLMSPFVNALVPSSHNPRMFLASPRCPSPCREVKFAAIPEDETQEARISSTSSEPLSLTLYVERSAVPDFSTYYSKLENRAHLNLQIKPDPSEPWDNEFEKERWKKQAAGMDESDFDWVPWLPLTHGRRVFSQGNTNISVIPMHWQQQEHMRLTPVHYLSDEARQPVFVNFSDVAVLRSMSSEERDLTAPLAQPYTRVFAKGEELYNRYFTSRMGDMQEQPIYVGDTWINKVLSVTAEGQRDRDGVESLFAVQL